MVSFPKAKALSPASLAAASQSRLKALQRQMWSCSGEQRGRGRGRRKQEGWEGEAVCSHGTEGGTASKSRFWEKPPRVVIGAAWSFLPLSVWEQGKATSSWLCNKRQSPAAWSSHSPWSTTQEEDKQKGGRTQADLRELSVSFHQPSSWVTVYLISLRLSQPWPEPKKTTKELFFTDLNDREKFILVNAISYCKPAPFTAS